jgi:rhodanese-related sulfurtransferase
MIKIQTHSGEQRNAGFTLLLVKRVLFLLGFAALCGGLSILINPKSPNYGQGTIRKGEIPLTSVPSDENVLWVDARSADDYAFSHVKGAILINEDDYYTQIGNFLSKWKNDDVVVVYCSSEACPSAESIVLRLKNETAVKKIYVIHGGWENILNSPGISIVRGTEE